MVSSLKQTIQFDLNTYIPKHGVALIYDLEGFTKFANLPDVQVYVPRFLNHVSEAMSTILFGGNAYWTPTQMEMQPLILPVHEKYLGDGALYVWTLPIGDTTFSEEFMVNLCNRIWALKAFFDNVLKKCEDKVPITEIPRRIRFGLASGGIFEMQNEKSKNIEYIGVCINLASRLQNYCPELGFIASDRIGIPKSVLNENDYIRVIAEKIRGFPKEKVIVDRSEFDDLDENLKTELFKVIE